MSQAEKIRVCLVAPSLEIPGGQARQAARLQTAFRGEPALAIGFIPHNPRLPAPFDRLQELKFVRTVVTTLSYWALLLAQLWRYDIVHVFSASYFSYLLSVAPAILLGKLYGKRVILNYRSGEAEDHLQRWPLTTKPVMRLADRIIVPSGYLVEVFGRFGLPASFIFNAVEPERFRFRARAPLAPRFLCTRLLEPLYNVAAVLRAFGLVQQQYPAAGLTIAGAGSLRAELEALAGELKLSNVTFAGFVPYAEMPALYDAHDVYWQANDIDNMPASIIEAFACGLPVVATRAGGVPYLVTHETTGLLVACGDYIALAQQALRLLGDGELAQRLTQNAFAEAQRYTWAAVHGEWLRLYDELMAEETAPTAVMRYR